MRRFFQQTLVVLAVLTAAAHADTISTFTLNANLDPAAGAGAKVTGTLLIDVTTGVLTGSDLTSTYLGKTYAVSGLTSAGTLKGGANYDLTFGNIGAPTTAFLSIVFPIASLQGYTGGSLCYELNPCNSFTSSYFAPSTSIGVGLTSGFLSYVAPPAPPVSTTPEPSSLMLLGTGIAGVAGALKRRRHNQSLSV